MQPFLLIPFKGDKLRQTGLSQLCFSTCRDHYLATVTWVSDERVAVQWLNRTQNYLTLQIYNFSGSSWDPDEVNNKML